LFGALDISTSALEAQRVRLDAIRGNMANQFTVFDEQGNLEPYRRRIPVFAPGDPSTGSGQGVHVREILHDPAPFKQVFVGEGHPLANDQGYMELPNINPMIEMANALEASRAYEANITVAETTKTMLQAAVSLLA